ncbi:MAG: hypothetical protein P8Y30_09085, partial [candidate division WOR-3 bacterium]
MKRLIFVPILFALFIIFNCTPSIQVASEEEVDRIYENAMKAYAEQNYKEANDLFLVVAGPEAGNLTKQWQQQAEQEKGRYPVYRKAWAARSRS